MRTYAIGNRIVPLTIKNINDIQRGDFIEITVDYIPKDKNDSPCMGFINQIPVIFKVPETYPAKLLLSSNGKEPDFKEGDTIICEVTSRELTQDAGLVYGIAIGEGTLGQLKK